MINLLAQIAQTIESSEKPPTDRFEFDPTSVLWIVGIVLLSFFMVRAAMRRVARSRQRSQLPLQERLAESRQKVHASYDQMNELMAALADLSRQINGQIDTRLAKLETLLHQADQTIKQLGELVGGEDNTGRDSQISSVDAIGDTIQDISGEFHSANADSQPQANEAGPQESPRGAAQLTAKEKQVLEMVKKGLNTIAIARKLNQPVGEIELILSLAAKKEKPN